MPELPELNPVIHGTLRLALLSLLAGVDEIEDISKPIRFTKEVAHGE